jgi:uncharacterized membrane protein YphA (DoxX/SURF4 family)
MSKARLVVRILLGVAWVFFGLNGFLHVYMPPAPTGGDAATVFAGLMAMHYVFPVMAAIEVVAGVLLLAGRFVPLALMLLAPLLVNILGYHLAVELKGIGLGAVLTAMELFLAWAYRDAFQGVLRAQHPFEPATK